MMVRPLQRFLDTEVSGGVLLLLAGVLAMVWVNSPIGDSYERLWRSELGIDAGAWSVSRDLRHWINDGLMATFFFVVGLEIKRELVSGELVDRRAAALPVIAAIGGMAVPAVIFLAFTAGQPEARGFGTPMATDIAFAVGVLALLGRRVPPGLRAMLLALAIVDDLGSIVVIAAFAGQEVAWGPLAAAAGLVALIVVLGRWNVRWAVYAVLGVGAWLAAFGSGISPTVAAALLGLVIPVAPSPDGARTIGRLELSLHPWTSYLIVPLFGLANAGIRIEVSALGETLTSGVALGVIVGRVVGKPLGIGLAAWIAVRAGLARLPSDVGWLDVVGLGVVAGIGFAVSLVVIGLTLQGAAADSAKLGLMAAALASGLLGGGVLLLAHRRERYPSPPASSAGRRGFGAGRRV